MSMNIVIIWHWTLWRSSLSSKYCYISLSPLYFIFSLLSLIAYFCKCAVKIIFTVKVSISTCGIGLFNLLIIERRQSLDPLGSVTTLSQMSIIRDQSSDVLNSLVTFSRERHNKMTLIIKHYVDSSLVFNIVWLRSK